MSITTYGLVNLKRNLLRQLAQKVWEEGKKLSFEGRVIQKFMNSNIRELHDSIMQIKDFNKKKSILKLCLR